MDTAGRDPCDPSGVSGGGKEHHHHHRAPHPHPPHHHSHKVVDVEMGLMDHQQPHHHHKRNDSNLSGIMESNHSFRNVFPNSLRNDVNIDLDHLPRLVLRNRAFHQSSNKIHIQHNQGVRIYALLRHNWFHVFLRWPTRYSLLALISIWTSAILVFAVLYIIRDSASTKLSVGACGLGIEGSRITFAAAFAFSLETCTTVGYGLPNGVNSFFEQGCSGLQIVIYLQMAWSMLFNAFLITFLYNRLGRSESRGAQVIYSDKALVSIVDGQIRFQVRLFDCDAKHPVVEAHVRLYCVMKHRPIPRPLRLLQPDDDLGGMVFLSFPSVVAHNIDLYSLLHPPIATPVSMKPKGLVLRQVDGKTGNRDDVICPICGESYGTLQRWKDHVLYSQIVEKQDAFPKIGTHLELDLKDFEAQVPDYHIMTDLQSFQDYFRDNISELLCLVEGIDPMQSGTFQALQSYRYDDIVWEQHSQFAPCLTVVQHRDKEHKKHGRIYEVDLERYHDIVQDPDAEAAAKEQLALKEAEELKQKRAEFSGQQVPRKRHRRVKTLSNRTSDSLFTPPDAAVQSAADESGNEVAMAAEEIALVAAVTALTKNK